MSDKIKLYQYDYAAYFTGKIMEIESHEGYNPAYLTNVPVPEIPDGHYAKFDKSEYIWIITDREPPPFVQAQDVLPTISENQTEPTVI